MKQKQLRLTNEFSVVHENAGCQFAEMALKPGATEGGPDNRHRGADQWLFVVSGKGVAIVNGKSVPLDKWTLVLIERGETHEIRNTGRTVLRTVNLYHPPAYTSSGETLPAGRP